jgi:hypothetical protein
MERFEIVSSCIGPGNHGIAQRPQLNGNWVKFLDVEPLIAALRTTLHILPAHSSDCDPSSPGKFKCKFEALRADIERLTQ